MAESGDTVLIAGKGHEDYQVLSHRTVHFDDAEEALQALAGTVPSADRHPGPLEEATLE